MKDKLDRHYTPDAICNDMVRTLRPRVGKVVLDPACGDGQMFRAIERCNYACEYIGLDIDAEAISKCKKEFKGQFKIADINEWKDTYGADYAIMNPPFHVKEWQYAARKAVELFKEGIVYIPLLNLHMFDLSNMDEFIIHRYPEDYLKEVFNCEIKYPQGYVYWRKTCI